MLSSTNSNPFASSMVGRVAKFVALGLCAAMLSVAGGPEADARTRSYAIADFDTGVVLKATNADTQLHPASLTKMMTIYLVLEAVRAGKLSLDQKITISERASKIPPTSLGIRKGEKILLKHLIAAAAVKSANDAAVALAEAVAGSEARFAQLMTNRARTLGMTRTTFKNATGFTARGHLSTARDMTVLGRRLILDFPEHYKTFGRRSIRWGGRNLRATNWRLLNGYRGADGIKTGYTRAAGYTMVASAKRDGRRVLVSYFGAGSSGQRAKRVSQLLTEGFKLQKSSRVLVALKSVDTPTPRPDSPHIDQQPETTPAQPIVTAAEPTPTPPTPTRTTVAAPAAGNYAVQVGAFGRELRAQRHLQDIAHTHATLLNGAEPWVPRQRNLYLARFVGFDEPTARATCQALDAEGIDCLTIKMTSVPVARTPIVSKTVLTTTTGDWAVQVGAYSRASQARARLDKLRHIGIPWLKDRPIRVPRPGRYYLAHFIGFDETSARIACDELRGHRVDCLAVRTTASSPPPVAKSSTPTGWSIQVGAFRRASDARKELNRVLKANIDALSGHEGTVPKRGRNYVARINGFDAISAASACSAVQGRGFECLVLAPAGSRSTPTATNTRSADSWAIQVGAYRKRSQAQAQTERVRREGPELLTEARVAVRKQGRYYLAQFRDLEESQATAACEALRSRGVDCLRLAPRRR